MTAQPWLALPIALVCALTVLGGMYGLRLSRTTSDFYVAGRAVGPWTNASAIGGEYLSAASFLGVAGIVYLGGVDTLWFPVGYTLGYLVLLVLVAAPLRRSGAYTASDFAQARLERRGVRRLSTLLAILIGWLYLLPQLHGAGLALQSLTGAPAWVGGMLVCVVVTFNVVAGGMRSVTLVQAVQYWFKLAAIAVPALILLGLWWAQGAPAPQLDLALALDPAPTATRAYVTVSTLVALCLGTMGLPHVLVRFYTNPNGRAARRTTVAVIALLGAFYLFPPLYAILGRVYRPPTGTAPAFDGRADAIVLQLPQVMSDGPLGRTLLAVLAAGAFAAFLSTASGLAVAVTGALDQDVVRPGLARITGGDAEGVHSFRLAALLTMLVPAMIFPSVGDIGLATTVTLAFAVAASTFAPLLVLGVWWPRLSSTGALAGLAVGGVTSLGAATATVFGVLPPGAWHTVVANPAAWSVPLATLTMILVSLATPGRVPANTRATMMRLHLPEGAFPGRSGL
ncbi:cation/acetate symporter [Kineosphaera limosa]|uniref:Sodium/solute symporter family protein n=1 Tax=Kineosphaera limosa NBRC 100340 TaxID=1184609 RepID=K6VM15_9MICO|nr:cation acetate symporter [Kineosphaera limosa]NYE00160.1 cation/acetate symporter [Kineosphaera limosa]GAB97258.1 sodium/solute symporter family protein [Kineosphaera limosa NBRC 100340]